MMHSAMKDIYDRLRPLGFDAAFVKNCILPDWWQDKLADVPSNRQYAEALIARHLGIQAASLSKRDTPLQMRESAALKLKRRHGVAENEMQVAQILGERLAKIAAGSIDLPTNLDSLKASSIRQHILDSGAKWVGFNELLNYCWSVGIPVVNLCKLPVGSKKPDGMAIWTEDRPVIVIASGRKHPAWHIFVIAHELGHIALGHLSAGELSIDSKVVMDSNDQQEMEANTFAVELLSGNPYLSFSPPNRRLTAHELADAALSIGQELHIDPGFIALSYSRSQNFFALAQAALNYLGSEADACSLYRQPYNHLDSTELTDDNKQVFEYLTEAA